MSEYTPRHLLQPRKDLPPPACEKSSEVLARMASDLEAAITARRTHPSLPPVGRGEIDGLIDEYRGSYESVREAVTALVEGEDWQAMLNELSENVSVYGAFTVDWIGVEEVVRDSFHLIEDGNLVHVFDIGPGETPVPPIRPAK